MAPPANTQTRLFSKWQSLLFYGSVLALMVFGLTRVRHTGHPALIRNFLKGDESIYTRPASDFGLYRKNLPPGETVSLITSRPFESWGPAELLFYYDLQNFLAPVVLSPQPTENIGIVYTPSRAVADKRLRETGYRLIAVMGEGKALIMKS